MQTRSLLLGIAVGVGLGWLLASTIRPGPELNPEPRADPITRRREPTITLEAREDEDAPPGADRAETMPGRLRTFREGDATEIITQTNFGEGYSGAETTVLIDRIDAARAARDKQLFHALLWGLAKAKRPEAEEKLLALIRDGTLTFPSGTTMAIEYGLADSALPGIVEAVRDRIERERAASDPPPRPDRNLLRLLATFATDPDIDWILALDDGGWEFQDAITKSGNPRLARIAIERMERGEMELRHLDNLVRRNPEVCREFARRLITEGDTGETNQFWRYFRAWVRTVPDEDLAAAKSVLLGLRGEERRLHAVYAVRELERRGMDVSGLEPILNEPVRILEGATPESVSRLVWQAAHTIKMNRVAQTDRALAAIESAANRLAGTSSEEKLREILAEIRRSEKSEWR